MREESTRHVTRTSIVSAFTIATALIWKDVIEEGLRKFAGPGDELMIQAIVAILATIVSILAIRLFLHAEDEAELAIKRFAHYIEPHDLEGRHHNGQHHEHHKK